MIEEKIINTITNGVGVACQTQNNLMNSCSIWLNGQILSMDVIELLFIMCGLVEMSIFLPFIVVEKRLDIIVVYNMTTTIRYRY